jgi:hypothetical protein
MSASSRARDRQRIARAARRGDWRARQIQRLDASRLHLRQGIEDKASARSIARSRGRFLPIGKLAVVVRHHRATWILRRHKCQRDGEAVLPRRSSTYASTLLRARLEVSLGALDDLMNLLFSTACTVGGVAIECGASFLRYQMHSMAVTTRALRHI